MNMNDNRHSVPGNYPDETQKMMDINTINSKRCKKYSSQHFYIIMVLSMKHPVTLLPRNKNGSPSGSMGYQSMEQSCRICTVLYDTGIYRHIYKTQDYILSESIQGPIFSQKTHVPVHHGIEVLLFEMRGSTIVFHYESSSRPNLQLSGSSQRKDDLGVPGRKPA